MTLIGIWRPTLLESIDEKPLATTISDLFVHFPYDRLPNNKFLAFFLPPINVFCILLFYLLSKPIFQNIGKTYIKPQSTLFVRLVAIHNLGLTIFSAIVAYNAWAVVMSHLVREGLFNTYCDPNGTLWASNGNGGFGSWAVIFYISKFYEFMDTWILLFKGKKASFLQVYHHTGKKKTIFVCFSWMYLLCVHKLYILFVTWSTTHPF